MSSLVKRLCVLTTFLHCLVSVKNNLNDIHFKMLEVLFNWVLLEDTFYEGVL